MSKKKEIIRHASVYLSATLLTQAITLISSLLTKRFMGPVQQGVWSLLQVFIVYISWSNFGVTETISCQIPYHRSREEHAEADRIKNSVFTFSMAAIIVVCAGFVAYAFLNRAHLQEELFYGLLFLAVVLILQRYSTLQICFLRGEKNFNLASKLTIYSSIVNAILVIALSYRYQIYGFMVAMCISYCFDLLFIMTQHKFNFRIYLNWRIIREAINFGFPIQLAGVATGFYLSADRIMIAKFMSFKELGLYSVALMVFSYLRNFSSPVCVVLLPNLHEEYGKTGDSRQLGRYMVKAGTFFSNVMPLLIGWTWFALPYLVARVIPDYIGGIPSMRCLILAGFFLSLYQTYSYIIALVRKQIFLLIALVGVAVLAFGLDYLALSRGMGMESVAAVNTILSFVLFAAIYFYSARFLFTISQTWKHFLIYSMKFVLMIAALVVLTVFFPNSQGSLVHVFVPCFIIVLIFLPFWLKMLKEYDIFNLLKGKWANPTPKKTDDPI